MNIKSSIEMSKSKNLMSCLDDISSFWAFSDSDTSCLLDTMGVKNPCFSDISLVNNEFNINDDMNNNNNNNKSSSNSPTVTTTMEKEAVSINPVEGQKRSNNKSSSTARRKKDVVLSSNEKEQGESEHEIHIWTERERRKKMRNMFSTLHSLLPQLPPKADKSTIVDEAIKYIKTLEDNLQTLQKQKPGKLAQGGKMVTSSNTREILTEQEPITREAFLADHQHQIGPETTTNNSKLPLSFSTPAANFQTWLSPNVVINVCGDEAQISICSQKRVGLSATIFYILQKHKLDVLSAHISSENFRAMYMIHVRARGVTDDKELITEALSVEDIFKLAAGEVNLWLSCSS